MRKPIKLPEGYNYPTINIPIELYLDNNLSCVEIFLMKEIYDLHNNQGCFATNQHLADYLGVSVPRIKQIISSLIERNYLTAEYEYNKNGIVKKRTLKPVQSIENYPCQGIENYPYQSIENYTDRINNIKNTNIENKHSIVDNKKIYNKNLKELRSSQSDLLDFEKPLVHSMSDALDGLAKHPDKLIRGRSVDEHFRSRMLHVAKLYADRYYKEYGKHHPYINPNDEFSPMQNAVIGFVDGDRSIIDLSDEDIEITIDLFFKDRYFDNTDRRINIFAKQSVWVRRVKEMERLTGKPGYYGIGIWQIEESEPDGWWMKDKMPDEWNECSKVAQ